MRDIISVSIKTDNTEEFKEEMERRVRKALTAVGIQVASHARTELQKSPTRIDTGLLRNSITHALDGESPAIGGYSADRPSKYINENSVYSILQGAQGKSGTYGGTMPKDGDGQNSVYVGTNVEYAEYIHEGFNLPSGKKVEPNRYLKNAVENNKGEIISIIKQELT